MRSHAKWDGQHFMFWACFEQNIMSAGEFSGLQSLYGLISGVRIISHLGSSGISCQNVSSCHLDWANGQIYRPASISEEFHVFKLFPPAGEDKGIFQGKKNPQHLLLRNVRKTSGEISTHYFYRGDWCMIACRQLRRGNTFLSETQSLRDRYMTCVAGVISWVESTWVHPGREALA